MKSIVALLGALCALVPTAASAKEPRTFTPSGQWNMNYADDSCRLAREFKNGEKSIVLALERFEPRGPLLAMVVGDEFSGLRDAKISDFAFGPGGKPTIQRLFYMNLASGKRAYVLGTIPLVPSETSEEGRLERMRMPGSNEVELAQAEAITEFRIGNGPYKEVTIQLGNMRAPIGAMHACTSELLSHWGIDAQRHETLKSRATPTNDLTTLGAEFKYPASAAAGEMDGTVRFRLMVDEAGTPTSCTIQKPSGPEQFIKSACDTLMRVMTFEPARDAQDIPLPSYWVGQIRFEVAH